MKDIGKIISGFFALIVGLYILSTLAKELPVNIGGINFGTLIIGAFIFFAIAWIWKEVLGK